MAITYNGTNTDKIKDRPVTATNTPPVVVSAPDYVKTYTVSVLKSAVDLNGDDGVNFDALITAIDAAILSPLLEDFDATKTVTASGVALSFTLTGGTKYNQAGSTTEYVCLVECNITVV